MTIVGFKPVNHPQQVAKRGGEVCDDTDDRRTTPDVFAPWNARYRFTLDAAANAENAKCTAFYSRANSGMTNPWHGRVWCNPPWVVCACARRSWRDGCVSIARRGSRQRKGTGRPSGV